jgi:lysophospholipase L1-like esterase
MTWPATAGVTVCTGTPCTAWGTSLGTYGSGSVLLGSGAVGSAAYQNSSYFQLALTNPVTGPGSGATVGHMAVMGNTSGTSITDGGAVPTLSSLGGVSTSTAVNGHALSSNVTVSASDLTTGTLPHAQLPTLLSGDIPNNAANTSGNAATATALGSAPTTCTTGNAPTGVLANGNATGCAAIGGGGGGVWGSITGTISNQIDLAIYPGVDLPKWRLALAKMRTGTSDARILAVGDSTTGGYDATSNAYTYPTQLANILKTAYTNVSSDFSDPATSLGQTTYYALGTGWSGNVGGSISANSAGSTSTTYTPGGSTTYDTFDVYYLCSSSSGTLTMQATGGSSVPVVTGTGTCGAAGVHKTTITAALPATTNAVTLSATSGTVYVIGVDPSLSTTTRIRVSNLGFSGAKTSDFYPVIGGYGFGYTLQTYAPDLCIIWLGVNDAGASVAATTYATNLAGIVTYCQASGDVILMTLVPSSGSPYTTYEPEYLSQVQSVAATSSLPIVDIWDRYKATWQTSFMSNALHPNNSGYLDIAGAISKILIAAQ